MFRRSCRVELVWLAWACWWGTSSHQQFWQALHAFQKSSSWAAPKPRLTIIDTERFWWTPEITGAAAVAFTPAMTPLLARTFRSSSAAILQGQSGDRLVRSQIFSCLRWGHNLAASSPSPLRQSFCWSCLSMARSTAALATAWAGCRWWTVASRVAFHSGGRGVGVLPYDGRIVAYRKGCGQASDNWRMNTGEIGVLDPANKDMAKP